MPGRPSSIGSTRTRWSLAHTAAPHEGHVVKSEVRRLKQPGQQTSAGSDAVMTPPPRVSGGTLAVYDKSRSLSRGARSWTRCARSTTLHRTIAERVRGRPSTRRLAEHLTSSPDMQSHSGGL